MVLLVQRWIKKTPPRRTVVNSAWDLRGCTKGITLVAFFSLQLRYIHTQYSHHLLPHTLNPQTQQHQ